MAYAGNPNGQNQLWSRWTFTVLELGRRMTRKNVELNAARYLRRLFGQAGALRVRREYGNHRKWLIDLQVEGVPAHDKALVAFVRIQFQRHFVERGWGPLSASEVEARVLAGSKQDGEAPEQWISVPAIIEAREE